MDTAIRLSNHVAAAAIAPVATLAQRAYAAGMAAHGEADAAYRFEVRSDWDARMETVGDAFEAWAWRADVTDADWAAAEAAFAAGWQAAVDGI